MRTFKMFGAAIVALSLSLNSFAISLPNKAVEPVVTTATTIVEPSSKNYSYTEMKQMVEAKTGKKLNFSQKLALRLTKGKINKAFNKAGAAGNKSQLTAALLCFFLGGIGIHDFYLGRTANGIIKIVVTIQQPSSISY